MKKILLSLLAFASFAAVQAQVENEMRTATLLHEGQTTVFSGVDALILAHNAAADTLDVITLSSGGFNPIDITKSITLRGAGFEGDSTKGILPTTIYGDLRIVPGENNKVNGIVIEGLRFNSLTIAGNSNTPEEQQIHDMLVSKCYLNSSFYANSKCHNVILRQCYVQNEVTTVHSYYYDNMNIDNLQLFNCNLGSLSRILNSPDNPSTVLADHCIVRSAPYGFIFTNCVINGQVGDGSWAVNNVLLGQNGLNERADGHDNYFGKGVADVLADGSTSLEYFVNGVPHSLEVNEEFLGADGTPVGVFGGDYKWNPIPMRPRIIEFKTNVTDDNKKLHVTLKADVPSKL
ncbi:MAG: hypothetical protein IKH19_00700 [Muribaculaceae bacterium]|nr:hypothetical protein [Muribaculaceae bacterium]